MNPKAARDQVFTVPTTIEAIMRQPTFALGVDDARAGRPYHADYDRWNANGQWDYERGRCWARLAPRDLRLKIGRKVNPEAIGYYGDEIR